MELDAAQNPNPEPPISAYYQTRAEHHAVVSSDWLDHAAAAASLPDAHADADAAPPPSPGSNGGGVIEEFNFWRRKPEAAEAVAAIMALAAVIRSSRATTMMELEIELKKASDKLKARKTIAMLSQDFISDGCTMLVHGYSRVVLEILKLAASSRKLFRVLCTEGRPDRTGLRMSNELAALGIPVKVLIDSAVAYSMDEVDMVFVGADGVVESGGIINMMGTYQIALVAHSMNKPLYVAAESYKFARLYPLDQKDMTPAHRPIDFGVPIPAGVEVETSARDYTPPQYLTLLLTDLGVLTPSVVSDELIQLYL
ncbi:translation initiation factor eIF-2B subunit alpha-like isoform X2 [Triticum dicoccoides]|uniref:translation initiation factor eIF-2B subunit alpha-like isoform X2 n=1 Tax=Triticum dicoccoides TaxID=85692 RepID=UPI00188E292D|nr:translation initiation factor eIF-2B subunit alpha-like isoform X2 [Triticum dicoccoides]